MVGLNIDEDMSVKLQLPCTNPKTTLTFDRKESIWLFPEQMNCFGQQFIIVSLWLHVLWTSDDMFHEPYLWTYGK